MSFRNPVLRLGRQCLGVSSIPIRTKSTPLRYRGLAKTFSSSSRRWEGEGSSAVKTESAEIEETTESTEMNGEFENDIHDDELAVGTVFNADQSMAAKKREGWEKFRKRVEEKKERKKRKEQKAEEKKAEAKPAEGENEPEPTKIGQGSPDRWLSEFRSRIGKCISFGLSPEQILSVSNTLRFVAKKWRELDVGRSGFLPDRSGFEQKVLWGDMDSMGHVNNYMYLKWAESGRVNWVRQVGLTVNPANRELWNQLFTPNGTGLILQHLNMGYKIPLKFPDTVSVFHKIAFMPQKGQKRFTLDTKILSERHQRVSAAGREDLIMYDYEKGKITEMPDYVFNTLKKEFDLQQAVMRKSKNSMKLLTRFVRNLEKATWDKPDAVEDLGSAAEAGVVEELGRIDNTDAIEEVASVENAAGTEDLASVDTTDATEDLGDAVKTDEDNREPHETDEAAKTGGSV